MNLTKWKKSTQRWLIFLSVAVSVIPFYSLFRSWKAGLTVKNQNNISQVQEKQPLKPKPQVVPRTQQSPKQEVPTSNQHKSQAPETPKKENALESILVVDQFDEPIEQASVWLEDERGKTYPSTSSWASYWSTDRVGRVNFFTGFDSNTPNTFPDGKYTVRIEKKGYSPVKESINFSSSPTTLIISPNKLVLYKMPRVTGILLGSSGEPVGNQTYMSPNDSTGGYSPRINIIDNYGKVVYETKTDYGVDSRTGRFESEPLPQGHYLLKVSIPGGYLKPEFVMATKEFDISYEQKEVWLDRITVIGTKTTF